MRIFKIERGYKMSHMHDEQIPNYAREYAVLQHGDQKYGDKSYFVHLDAVHDIIAEYFPGDYKLRSAAYLHDVLEDTQATYKQLVNGFGPEVAVIVSMVTDPTSPTRDHRKSSYISRKERKTIMNKRLGSMPEGGVFSGVRLVKVADRLANVRIGVAEENMGKLSMYRKEHKEFRSALLKGGYHEEVVVMMNEIDRLLVFYVD